MDSLHVTLQKIEKYAADAGVSPVKVCRDATGNPRLYKRLKGRAKSQAELLERLTQYMADNPVSHSEDG